MIDGEKLRTLLKAQGVSVMELARRLGWTGAPTYLYNLMNGKHEATQEFLERVSEALGVPPVSIINDSLLQLLGANKYIDMVAEDAGFYQPVLFTIPIVGYASAGSASAPEYTNGDTPSGVGILGGIDPAQDFGPGAYAIRVKGDSMLPRFRNGNLLIVSPAARWGDGDTCLVRHVDGRVWIKRLTAHGSTLCLESDNPTYPSLTLRQNELAYIHRVTAALLR